MGAKRARGRVAWALGIGAVLGAYGLAACDGDDTNPARPNPNSSSSGGVDATTGEGGDEQPDAAADPLLCSRNGGYQAVQSIAADILTAAKADCRISADFTALQTPTHLQECLSKQLGTWFQCPGVAYDKDSAGNRCRSMNEAHQDLGLRQADFDAFLGDAVNVLKAHKLSSSDLTTIRSTMLGTQAAIVRQPGKGNANCTCPNLTYDGGSCGIPGIDGGKDGGADDGGDGGTIADAADDGG